MKGLRPKNPDLGPWRFGSKSKEVGPLARWAGNPSGATKRQATSKMWFFVFVPFKREQYLLKQSQNLLDFL